jgi:hypothetical protein
LIGIACRIGTQKTQTGTSHEFAPIIGQRKSWQSIPASDF